MDFDKFCNICYSPKGTTNIICDECNNSGLIEVGIKILHLRQYGIELKERIAKIKVADNKRITNKTHNI